MWNNEFYSDRFKTNIRLTFHLFQRMKKRLITEKMIQKTVEKGIMIKDEEIEGKYKILYDGIVVVLYTIPFYRIVTVFNDV